MRELSVNEVIEVSGAVDQDTAISTNATIVTIGAGIAVAGSAPAWFPIAMIAVSLTTTYSYISDLLED
ncbi:hypothetical protein KO525_02460 [Psychrosphaera sp. B3R10]|uniref:hypothetical protein n=1 Tax=unclassified Psychrosphaera TaxID=2641570 RepID=UPI001C086FE9|nr:MULTISPECIES: hypothetical protein [unclassified Psychrosphaera]MBU2884106.1 hypothetical protein [Psychrosphaera sp. I2R16]MBU2988236.1 hypothetical protein [Psychrosphaera sp. B3R10]MDO6718444.1 hypothetical protein [Psychrosphaera sp. 1_MG-2023]